MNKHCLYKSVKEFLISFLMVCKLIDFILVILKQLTFKVCGIIGISKIDFFLIIHISKIKFFKFLVLKGFSKTKKFKNHSKTPKLVNQSFPKYFQQYPNIYLVFHWNFNSFAPWVWDNTKIPSKSNISKKVGVGIAFTCFLNNIW